MKTSVKEAYTNVVNQYQQELKMSVDITQFPHSFNILRRLIMQIKEKSK